MISLKITSTISQENQLGPTKIFNSNWHWCIGVQINWWNWTNRKAIFPFPYFAFFRPLKNILPFGLAASSAILNQVLQWCFPTAKLEVPNSDTAFSIQWAFRDKPPMTPIFFRFLTRHKRVTEWKESKSGGRELSVDEKTSWIFSI